MLSKKSAKNRHNAQNDDAVKKFFYPGDAGGNFQKCDREECSPHQRQTGHDPEHGQVDSRMQTYQYLVLHSLYIFLLGA